jgi:hypothetical protein
MPLQTGNLDLTESWGLKDSRAIWFIHPLSPFFKGDCPVL